MKQAHKAMSCRL